MGGRGEVTTARRLPGLLRKRLTEDTELLRRVAYETCLRGEAHAVRLTNERGLVDNGTPGFKGSWKTDPLHNGAELRNDIPYAGVIEHGRRPGRPGPPIEPIRQWVMRKLVANGEVEAKDAESVARAVRWSIHHKGTKPRFVLRDTVAQMRVWFPAEAVRVLRRKATR